MKYYFLLILLYFLTFFHPTYSHELFGHLPQDIINKFESHNYNETDVWILHPYYLLNDTAKRIVIKLMDDTSQIVQFYSIGITALETPIKNENIKKELYQKLIVFVKSNNYRIRAQAAKSLGENHFKEAIPILIEMLNDSSPHVREYSVYALRMMPTKKALKKIKDMSKTEKNKYIKREIEGYLWYYKDSR